MNKDTPYIPPFLRELMPEATPHEIAIAAERLRSFLVAVFMAHWNRLQKEQADSRELAEDDRVQKRVPTRVMNAYYAYIRVSTVKQGEKGSSLQEQRDSIERFAARSGFAIAEWFEERETAAKRGRSEFVRMMAALEKGHATGVILHKIDRGARNLWDWARIQDLVERHVEVHFAHENVDLKSRGGRLSADIQAVVAADYIRNLRDEVVKGIVGRLKQGLCPWGAPVGYLDRGKGTPKAIDPFKGPLVLMAFELYATGAYTVDTLRHELWKRGLRSRKEHTLGRSQVAKMLRNPFYVGLILRHSTGEVYQGAHEALVPKVLFDRVQDVLEGRGAAQVIEHDFRYRRLLRCGVCGRTLTGERHRNYIYYRCHTKRCQMKTIREERVTAAIDHTLENLRPASSDLAQCEPMFVETEERFHRAAIARKANAQLALEVVEKRHRRLLDAYLDGTLDKETFQQCNTDLLKERVALRETLARQDNELAALRATVSKCKLLMSVLPLSSSMLDKDQQRVIVKTLSSNIRAFGKNVVVELHDPFKRLGNALKISRCGHHRARVRNLPPRKMKELLDGELMLDLHEALRFWEPPNVQPVAKRPPGSRTHLLHFRPEDDQDQAA